jgi:predicted dehydrogenase
VIKEGEIGMADKARIGIIGVGFIGEAHIQGCQRSKQADVVAIADVNEELLRERQGTYQIPKSYSDYHKMLESEKLDGVIIATPDEWHRAPVEAVAAAGLPMLLEKPIATTSEDAAAIVGAVEKANVQVVMGFSLFFISNYVALKHRFDSGDLGVPRVATTRRACTVDEALRLKGRCTVNDYLAVHDFAYLLWLFGTDVESIYTTKVDSRVYEELETPDHYLNLLKWKDGAAASVFVTWGMPKGYPGYVQQEAWVLGSKGAGHVNLSGQQTQFSVDGRVEEPESPVWMYTFAAECGHFAEVALGRAQSICPLEFGLNAYKLIAAANESLSTEQAAKIAL